MHRLTQKGIGRHRIQLRGHKLVNRIGQRAGLQPLPRGCQQHPGRRTLGVKPVLRLKETAQTGSHQLGQSAAIG